MSSQLLDMTNRNIVSGLECSDYLADDDDPTPQDGRHRNRPRKRGSGQETQHLPPLHTIYVDGLSGFKFPTIGGGEIAYIAQCATTKYIFAACCKKKDDFTAAIMYFRNQIRAMGFTMVRLRSDSAREIQLGKARTAMEAYDIVVERTGSNDHLVARLRVGHCSSHRLEQGCFAALQCAQAHAVCVSSW